MVSFSNGPILNGGDAVVDNLMGRITEGSQVDIHGVATMDLGDGWAADGGWYEIMVDGAVVQRGFYLNIGRENDAGEWKTHWGLTNATPAAM